MLSIEKIKKEFPKSFVSLQTWFSDYIKNRGNLTTEVFARIPIDQLIDTTLTYNPRSLYDWLDENKIYINIIGHENSWKIAYSQNTPELNIKGNRVQAEEKGFIEAFSKLEKQLS